MNFRENNVISKLAELVTDLESFSRNVLRILEGRGLAVAWLNTLIDEEIAEASPSMSFVVSCVVCACLLFDALESASNVVYCCSFFL